MAINKNHEFEELGGIKCAIVEKNASKERVAFLKDLLEYNGLEVVVVPSPAPKPTPPPKPAPAPPSVTAAASTTTEAGPELQAQPPSQSQPQPQPQSQSQPQPEPPLLPETFTIGVTNLAFNPTNAIFGRLLRTKNGNIVTQAYWYQKDDISHDEIPYYEQTL